MNEADGWVSIRWYPNNLKHALKKGHLAMFVFRSTVYVKFMTLNGKIRSSNRIFHSSKRTVFGKMGHHHHLVAVL